MEQFVCVKKQDRKDLKWMFYDVYSVAQMIWFLNN